MNPKYPFLFNLFKLKFCVLYLLGVAIAGLAVLHRAGQFDAWGYFFLVVVPLVLPFFKLEMAWLFSHGHGVFNFPKILRIPKGVFILLVILGVLLGLLIWNSLAAHQGFSGDYLISQVMSFCLLFSIALGILRWLCTMYYNQWCASEYEVQLRMKAEDIPPLEIDRRVAYLYKEGWLSNENNYC